MSSSALVVDIQGAKLHRAGERLQVRDPTGQIRSEVPLFKLKQIWLLGNVEISNSMLRHSIMHGPWIHLLTLKGSWRGAIGPMVSPRAVLRLKQYRVCRKSETALMMAQKIISLKVGSQITQLKKWTRRFKNKTAPSLAIIDTVNEQIDDALTIEEIRGLEGYSSKAYFSAMSHVLSNNWLFTERNRRPPKDPVNALLSLGYTFLFSETLSEVSRSGLDPWIAFIHAPKSRRASLALDLMEPFRVEVDEMVLKALNLSKFSTNSFEYLPNGGCYMKKEAFPKFSLEFGKMLDSQCSNDAFAKATVRVAIRRFVNKIKNHIAHSTTKPIHPSAKE